VNIPSTSIKSPKLLVAALNELLKRNGRPELSKRVKGMELLAKKVHHRTLQLINTHEAKRQHVAQLLSAEDEDAEEEVNRTASQTIATTTGKDDSYNSMSLPTTPPELFDKIYRTHYMDVIKELIPGEDDRNFFTALIGNNVSTEQETISLLMQKWSSIFVEPRSSCKFMFNEEKQRFSISMDAAFFESVELSEQLAYIMGFPVTELRDSPIVEARFTPDMTGGVSSFNIYAPGLIEPVIIGDITAPLLRMVNIRGLPEENIEETYVAIQYHRLLVKEVAEIFIEIRSASGALMPFQYGNCILTLHFRKVPYF
jgi:hypothetical protein